MPIGCAGESSNQLVNQPIENLALAGFPAANDNRSMRFPLLTFRRLRALVVITVTAVSSMAMSSSACAADDLKEAATALRASHAKSLEELAAICDAQKLPALAKISRGWSIVRDPNKLYIFTLAESFAPPAAIKDSPVAAQWWERFKKLRITQAEKLFDLAKQAVEAKQALLAYELVQEAARENPDHAEARRILGFVQRDDRWVTPFAARKLDAGEVWHERFGWLPADRVKRYEDDQRYSNNRWVSAADDARIHANIKTGWPVETEHFKVLTNAGLEDGVKLGQQLELLYGIWRQVFVPYYAAGDLPKVFAGGAWPKERKTHVVWYFADRDDFVKFLQPSRPGVEKALGIYLEKQRTSYFFAGKDQHPGTVFHESTHQLFQESRTTGNEVGAKNNFWIIEAVACYMESLTEHDGYYTLGGFEEGRVPAAAHRLLVDNFYAPLEELSALGMDNMQRQPNIAPLYSQISGQAQFLTHFENGRYREALNDYLIAVYSGKADKQTLAKLTGQSFSTLDRQYRDYMKANAGK